MTRILDVPYRSQWDHDANKSNTDCGPACLAMVLGYYGTQAAINDLFTATGVEPGKLIGFGQLQQVARSYGITFEYSANHKLRDLKQWIDEAKPVIALVKYSYWSEIEAGLSTQDTYTGPHFVVVVGYGDGNIYINDPNYWPPRREEGHTKAWSEVLFNLAWSNVRTPSAPNPNNAVIVPTVGKLDDGASVADLGDVTSVIEYTVQPGDTWSGLAGRFYDNQTRYPEILAFNNLSAGAPLYVGQKLRIPVLIEGEGVVSPDQPVLLGQGAVQTVDTSLVSELKEKWIAAGKLTAAADEATVLRTFVDGIMRWDASEATSVEYIVQPGDTWAGIAAKFYGDQMRFREIMEFNQLTPDIPLHAGQKIRIPLD